MISNMPIDADPQQQEAASPLVLVVRSSSRQASMFLRFVVGGESEDHRQLTGLVTEARLLRDRGLFTSAQEEQLQDVYDWLNSNLPCPPFSTAGWSIDAVAWFKDSATGPIRQFRILAALLEQHDRGVRMLRSINPGKVLYEDHDQIVVEEWRHL